MEYSENKLAEAAKAIDIELDGDLSGNLKEEIGAFLDDDPFKKKENMEDL